MFKNTNFTVMETFRCPICTAKVSLLLTRKVHGRHVIVHENENYVHIQKDGKNYLYKTELNVKEEIGQDLVLN